MGRTGTPQVWLQVVRRREKACTLPVWLRPLVHHLQIFGALGDARRNYRSLFHGEKYGQAHRDGDRPDLCIVARYGGRAAQAPGGVDKGRTSPRRSEAGFGSSGPRSIDGLRRCLRFVEAHCGELRSLCRRLIPESAVATNGLVLESDVLDELQKSRNVTYPGSSRIRIYRYGGSHQSSRWI